MGMKLAVKFLQMLSETEFFSSEIWKCVLFNHGTKNFFECILATGFSFEIQQRKKRLFILTAFSRSEISELTVRWSNNGEFLHQKAPLNTTKKNLVIKIELKESKQHCHQLFFAKKVSDWIYIMFYPQMSNCSEKNFATETFWRSLVCELTKSTEIVTCSKRVKLPLVSFFELRFLRNVSSEP